MFRRRDPVPPWVLAGAAIAGAAALSLTVWRIVRRRRQRPTGESALDLLEEGAVAALRRDAITGRCAIDVAAIAPGMIELTGIVPTHEVGERAARLLHALPGVRTVINRLEARALEQHLAHNRESRARGEPWTRERQWYGVRVGTGRRRQSPMTDPGRDDDTVKRKTRELEVRATDVADATTPEPQSEEPKPSE